MPYVTDPDTGAQVPAGTAIPATARTNIRTSLTNHAARLDTLEAGIDDIPIGAATPSTGSFTTVLITGSLIFDDADTGPTIGSSANRITAYCNVTTEGNLTLADALSGSSTTSLIDGSVTWNTSGSPTAILLSVTNTASGASAKLIDLKVDTVSKFSVSKAGNVIAAGSIEAGLPIKMPFYNITLPTASSYPYSIAYFQSASGNKKLVFSDGTDWRYPDGTVA